jgi:transposase
MKATYKPGSVFLFGDGMHLIHQNIPGFCWGDPKNPPILQTNTGRKRLNVLGAYNSDSHSLVHLTGEENCNADRVVEFFEVILEIYKTAPRIVIFLDNATYFKAEVVSEWLKDNPTFQVEFLPPYAPNLNLIERFWRFVKEHLVRNTYYEKYKTFRAKTFQFLNHIEKHENELRTLMVEKFEIIKYEAKTEPGKTKVG